MAELGHDVVSAVDIDPRATDRALLECCQNDDRILTEDKDFGELVFLFGLEHPTIIRFVEMRVDQQLAAMKELIDNHQTDLESNAIIVVTPGRIRIRHSAHDDHAG